jgi:2-oxoglutarate ferredoxin oxidoreductase subunit beta
MAVTFQDWFREDRLPHIYCAGCGNGTIINCSLAAIEEMGWKKEETVFVSGIGCSSRAPGYILADSLHTTHGRALAFATGIKLANPRLHVVVFTGDGDLAAIGGNHFIHACRRNIDLTVVCINNQIYGMTGGQGSPTTPLGALSTTTPYGSREPAFDLADLAVAAGANYVARWTSYHVKELTKAVRSGLETKGLSFIEALAQCPTNYGRRNKFKQVQDQIEYLKTHAILKDRALAMESRGEKVPADRIRLGEFARRQRPYMGGVP